MGFRPTGYASACIICAMAYRAAVVGASGYTGAEALRLLVGRALERSSLRALRERVQRSTVPPPA